MATIINSLIAILFFSTLIIKGSCDCSLNNINIDTVRSGQEIQGKPEWHVTVFNNCTCSQSLVRLACKGFQTAESVDPSILSKESDTGTCLLINGNPLQAFASVSFSYAWDPPFLLLPTDSVIGSCDCSLNNINIGTMQSGHEILGKPEWHVTLTNKCSCSQSHIRLSCKGFQTTESVDPSVLFKEGDSGTCLIINGNPLQGFASVNFSYAWDPPFLLLPTNSVIGDCSGSYDN